MILILKVNINEKNNQSLFIGKNCDVSVRQYWFKLSTQIPKPRSASSDNCYPFFVLNYGRKRFGTIQVSAINWFVDGLAPQEKKKTLFTPMEIGIDAYFRLKPKLPSDKVNRETGGKQRERERERGGE